MSKYECTECGQEIESSKKPTKACKCGARGKWKQVERETKMKKFMLVFTALLLTSAVCRVCAHAGTKDYVKTEWCLPAFPYGMYIMAKNPEKPSQFLIAQTGSGLNAKGVIQLSGETHQKMERLNVLVQYIGSKIIKGADGFEHEMDSWKQCETMKGNNQ